MNLKKANANTYVIVMCDLVFIKIRRVFPQQNASFGKILFSQK